MGRSSVYAYCQTKSSASEIQTDILAILDALSSVESYSRRRSDDMSSDLAVSSEYATGAPP
jgi:hypothetical protein